MLRLFCREIELLEVFIFMAIVIFEHILLSISWIIGWLIFARMKFLRKQRSSSLPNVSVIIPARNEEVNLPKILSALQRQSYPNFEIIVVNDNSTDKTREIALSFKKVNLVDLLEEPPEGWVGKSWACWNGYLKATGEILIFMDADVEPSVDAVATLVSVHLEKRGLVSVWPYQRFEMLYEHLTLPFNMIVVGSIGSFSIFHQKPVGSYGPVMVVDKKTYGEVQGHHTTKNEILEDMKLGRLFVKKGFCVDNRLGGEIIKFRMYPLGIKQMFEGFTKNMSLGAASVGMNFFLSFLWMVGLYSAAFSVFDLSKTIYYLFFVVQIYFLSRKLGDYTILDAMFYPVHYCFFLVVFFISLVRVLFFRRVTWKGRRIHV